MALEEGREERWRTDRRKSGPYARTDREIGEEGGGGHINDEKAECYEGPERDKRLTKSSCTVQKCGRKKDLEERRPRREETAPGADGHAPHREGQEENPSEKVEHTCCVHRRLTLRNGTKSELVQDVAVCNSTEENVANRQKAFKDNSSISCPSEQTLSDMPENEKAPLEKHEGAGQHGLEASISG